MAQPSPIICSWRANLMPPLIDVHVSNIDDWLSILPIVDIRGWNITRLWQLAEQKGQVIPLKTRAFIKYLVAQIQRSQKTLFSDEQSLALIRKKDGPERHSITFQKPSRN
ncbi:hypothetical protein ACOZB2_31020 [Pantoea endophytica]|uniref:Uncharacterized protein n=1 Tax=Pantoea sp. BJ2 TaxID=3141322 RepID=A0AAU7U4C6_9GAMM